MKNMNIQFNPRTWIGLGIGAFFAGLIALFIYLYREKKRAEQLALLEKINALIDTGVGKGGGIDGVLIDVAPDYGFKNDAVKIAKIINDSLTWYNDDEEAIYAALKGLNRAQLAMVASQFKEQYGTDLHQTLQEGLSESEYQTAMSGIIK